MGKLKIFATLFFSALGIFGANEYYKPRNIRDLLKWKGIKLASDNRAWKSMFFENEEELKKMGIDSDTSLWSWCSERFKSTNLDDEKTLNDAGKFCSDSAKSIMGRIIREGEDGKVIKKDNKDAFSINYVLTGRSPEVLELIGLKEENPELKKVSEKLSEWCEEQKKTKIISKDDLDKFSDFKKRCYDRGVKSVSDLLKKQGRRPMTGDKEFQDRFDEELKNAPKLIDTIKGILNKRHGELWLNWEFRKKNRANFLTPEELAEEEQREKDRIAKIIPHMPTDDDLKKKGWSHYKWWCEKQLNSSLLAKDMYPDVYAVVGYRCTEKIDSN